MSEKKKRGVTKSQLEKLDNHTIDALTRIWAKCMQIINKRKRQGERRGVVILVDPEALAGGQAHSFRYKEQTTNRKGLRRVKNISCDGGCGYCIMGYKSKKEDPGTGCLFKDSKVKVSIQKKKKEE